MTSLSVAAPLVVGGAAVGIALNRALIRRKLRDLLSDARLDRGDRWSVRRLVEAVQRRGDLAEDGRRAAETAAERLTASLDVLQSGLVLCDDRGQVVARNAAAEVFLQARYSEALVSRVIKDLLERARGGERVTTTVELHTEPRRSYEVEARPVERHGQALGAVALVRDTTEHHRIESVRRDFVANVSHELKTPVGALSVLADSLAADPEPEVASRLAGRMQVEIQRVAGLIDGLLTLAVLEDEAGRGNETVEIDALVTAAVDRISETAQQRDIEVIVSVQEGLEPFRGSRIHLESAVFNLLDNAVKFSEPGGRADVVVETHDRDLQVSVSDEGIGIPSSERSRIFERFYRVDRARSRNTGGTGLGLSIVRHVALNHGGDVNVTSQEGYGSRFTITLPLDSAG